MDWQHPMGGAAAGHAIQAYERLMTRVERPNRNRRPWSGANG